jgi:hypothetical protein
MRAGRRLWRVGQTVARRKLGRLEERGGHARAALRGQRGCGEELRIPSTNLAGAWVQGLADAAACEVMGQAVDRRRPRACAKRAQRQQGSTGSTYPAGAASPRGRGLCSRRHASAAGREAAMAQPPRRMALRQLGLAPALQRRAGGRACSTAGGTRVACAPTAMSGAAPWALLVCGSGCRAGGRLRWRPRRPPSRPRKPSLLPALRDKSLRAGRRSCGRAAPGRPRQRRGRSSHGALPLEVFEHLDGGLRVSCVRSCGRGKVRCHGHALRLRLRGTAVDAEGRGRECCLRAWGNGGGRNRLRASEHCGVAGVRARGPLGSSSWLRDGRTRQSLRRWAKRMRPACDQGLR